MKKVHKLKVWCFAAILLFQMCSANQAIAQSDFRYDAILTDLMVTFPDSGGGRRRESYSIILDRFTGTFKICQTGRNSLQPGAHPCFETPAMSPNGRTPIFKFVFYNASRQAWVGPPGGSLDFSFYMVFFMDVTNGKIWCFQLRGDRNSSGNLNYDIWPLWN